MAAESEALQSQSRARDHAARTREFLRLCQLASPVFLTLAAIFFLLALALTPPFSSALGLGAAADLILDASTKSFGEARAQSEFNVTFTLTNVSPRPLKVIGAEFVCGPDGCLTPENLPLEIPAHHKRDLTVHVKTVKPGQFQRGVTLYTDCPGKPKVVINIRGRVAA